MQKVEAPKIETQRSGYRSKFWNRDRGLGVSTTALELLLKLVKNNASSPYKTDPEREPQLPHTRKRE